MSVWDQIVGQKTAVKIFETAAHSARALRQANEEQTEDSALTRQMSHAWLVTGPPGAGRSVAALAFAAALQCEDPQTPGCGQCPECKRVLKGTHPDVKVVTTERLIIKIEEISSLVTLAQQAPAGGKWRVILMEDADRMVERTSNLLLKAIEEPPPRTVWLLCTTQPADVLPTIRSRCRHVSLVTPSVEEVAQLLIEKQGITPETARQAAALSQSHIGVAKSLARDPEELERRRKFYFLPPLPPAWARPRCWRKNWWRQRKRMLVNERKKKTSRNWRSCDAPWDMTRKDRDYPRP